MSSLFLGPGSTANINASIRVSVGAGLFQEYCPQEYESFRTEEGDRAGYHCWAFPKDAFQEVWEADYLILKPVTSSYFKWRMRVKHVFEESNLELGRALWNYKDWQHLLIVDQVQPCNISATKTKEVFGYSNDYWFPKTLQVKEDRLQQAMRRTGTNTIDQLLEFLESPAIVPRHIQHTTRVTGRPVPAARALTGIASRRKRAKEVLINAGFIIGDEDDVLESEKGEPLTLHITDEFKANPHHDDMQKALYRCSRFGFRWFMISDGIRFHVYDRGTNATIEDMGAGEFMVSAGNDMSGVDSQHFPKNITSKGKQWSKKEAEGDLNPVAAFSNTRKIKSANSILHDDYTSKHAPRQDRWICRWVRRLFCAERSV